MSGNAMFTTNRSRLAMKTAAETMARTGPVRSCVLVEGIVGSFSELTLLRLVRATAHIRQPDLLSRTRSRGDRRPLDAARVSRRVFWHEALSRIRGGSRNPQEGLDRTARAAGRRRGLRAPALPGAGAAARKPAGPRRARPGGAGRAPHG